MLDLIPLYDPNFVPVDENGDPVMLEESDMEMCLHQTIGHEGPDESVGIFGHAYWCEDCGETDPEILFEGGWAPHELDYTEFD